jgi:hypothetical protein
MTTYVGLEVLVYEFHSISSMALEPLLGPGLLQKTPPFFSIFCSSPLSSYSRIFYVSLRTTSFHLVLGFSTGLLLWLLPLRTFFWDLFIFHSAAGAWPWPLALFYSHGHERVELYLYSPYGPYGLYRASVPVQGCTLPSSSVLKICPAHRSLLGYEFLILISWDTFAVHEYDTLISSAENFVRNRYSSFLWRALPIIY